MKNILGRELSIKEAMWDEQKKQIDEFNINKAKLNSEYSRVPYQESPVFAKTTGLAASDVPANEIQSTAFIGGNNNNKKTPTYTY